MSEIKTITYFSFWAGLLAIVLLVEHTILKDVFSVLFALYSIDMGATLRGSNRLLGYKKVVETQQLVKK